MTGLTDPLGNQTTWGYDAADRMTTMTDPLGHAATYAYNADDQLTDTTDRNGRRTTYAYDSGGRETGETWLNSSGGASNLVSYGYDADNELTSVSDNYATLSFTYDSGGNMLTQATSGPGTGQPSMTLTSGYDKFHNRTTLADNLGSAGLTTFQYDAAFRLTTIASSFGGTSGPQVVLGYDPANRLTSVSRTIGGSGTAVNTSYVYDAANRIGTITHQTGGGTSLASYVYNYDNANRVTSEVDKEGTANFGYDSGGELTGVTGSRSESYSYDSGGNRNMTGWTTGTGNELTASPGYTYTYDNEGNLINQTNTATHVATTFAYDNRNRLTQVSVGGSVVASYVYDALNHRIGINDNGTQTWVVFDGSSPFANPYADFNGSGTLLTRYLSGPAIDEIFARTSSGGTSAWYLPDRLGSVRDIANTSGTVIDHVVYDSYGNIVTETNASNGDRFKFTGMEFDAAIGQYYDHARWYGPAVGRFAQRDPKGFAAGDGTLYRYVANRPIDLIDTSGLEGDPPPSIPPGNTPPQPLSPSCQLYLNFYIKFWLSYQQQAEDARLREQALMNEMRAKLQAAMEGFNAEAKARAQADLEKILSAYMNTYVRFPTWDHCFKWVLEYERQLNKLYRIGEEQKQFLQVRSKQWTYPWPGVTGWLSHGAVAVTYPDGTTYYLDDGWWGGIFRREDIPTYLVNEGDLPKMPSFVASAPASIAQHSQ
jgi:RHS repeat-associated protein